MAFKALPVITDALALIGVAGLGEAPKADESAQAVRFLNMILEEWAAKAIYNPGIYNEVCPANGTASYTLGTGGDIATSPKSILQVQTEINGLVYPCRVLGTVADYEAIPIKTVSAIPSSAFWDYQQGSSTLYLYPTPPGGFSVRVIGLPAIHEIDNAQGTIQLPDDYKKALVYTLAINMLPIMPPTADQNPKTFEYLERAMNTALSFIKRRNSKKQDTLLHSDYQGTGSTGESYLTWAGLYP